MKQWKCALTVVALLGVAILFPSVGLAADAIREETAPGLEERIKLLEDAARKQPGAKWSDRVRIGGLVEVEAGYGKADPDDPAIAHAETSDVDLATVELAVDSRVARHVEGHVLFKYEADDLFVDEGYFSLSGSEEFPAYLIAGRQYLPFGNFDTHFVNDPNTLTLGETTAGALVVGYLFGGERLDLSAGVFKGAARKTGSDEVLDSYVAAIKARPMENLSLGVSYISNLASSNGLFEALADTDPTNDVFDPITLERRVGGWSAYLRYGFLGRFKLIGEYAAALEKFKVNELYDLSDGEERRPAAWNAELGVALVENVELAVRYGGADDGGGFLPDSQYGAVINWGIFDNTNLALEYLHSEYRDTLKVDAITIQVAVEF